MIRYYVLMVRTGHEKKATEEISNSLVFRDESHPFIPTREVLFRHCGKIIKEETILFPGYVFVESVVDQLCFHSKTYSIIKKTTKVLKILCYGNSNEIALHDNECEYLKSLWNCEYCIESSTGLIVGDKVVIQKGPLKGRESNVKKSTDIRCRHLLS